jgi:hypothetical protein
VPFPAALRRDPPTHLPLDPDDAAVMADITLECEGFHLRWLCDFGNCHRYAEFALDPDTRIFARRKAMVARALSHPDEARALIIDEALAALDLACPPRRCTDVNVQAAARLRALRAAPPWRPFNDFQKPMMALQSADRTQDLGCGPSECVLSLRTPGQDPLYVEVKDNAEATIASEGKWLVAIDRTWRHDKVVIGDAEGASGSKVIR